jgi:dTDP-glucose 4,6-dehydratase
MTILVTGGAGFIGSNFVLDWLAQCDDRHTFVQVDLGDRALVGALLAEHFLRGVLHFAAESHVERSIYGPEDFIRTNIVGAYCSSLPDAEKTALRCLHVITVGAYDTLS